MYDVFGRLKPCLSPLSIQFIPCPTDRELRQIKQFLNDAGRLTVLCIHHDSRAGVFMMLMRVRHEVLHPQCGPGTEGNIQYRVPDGALRLLRH
ncbi:hypothetical protein BaRGS_00010950 [Batillaria attramentaria]|uniref:Uncharacterized protein n=1 Tax=Batillaria attramentaria TaxID=370345 RepID=A0ABD0LEB8_9CAEN